MLRIATTGIVLSLATFVALAPAKVRASDETSDTAIEVRAPLDSTACTATPPTITVLGVAYDVSTAVFDDNGSGGQGGDGSGSGDGSGNGGGTPGGDDGDTGGGTTSTGSCAGLTPGQTVDIKFSSDAPPTVAAVETSGDQGLDIKGPIQAVDATAKTVTILGFVIDVSSAEIGGSDNEDDGAPPQATTLDQLVVGQVVEVKLDAGQLPALVAAELDVKNFTNEVDVEVDDQNGNEVDDMDDSGNPVDDVDVSVTETVKVTSPTGTQRVKRTIAMHKLANGSFRLSGLPTGMAKITVTRSHAGAVSSRKKSVKVRANTVKALRVHLH
ncbi:MAG: carboxypeptidase regulatory-like domain-containing protein [Deltaproteobacteria bacterium]|nr:carboxypeptidase regulatory-like domain-containing protein [Deltaproteobacteria bacterium]